MDRTYRCLHCRHLLSPDDLGLLCSQCGRSYPSFDGITLLVGDPAAYLRAELALIANARSDTRQRRSLIERIGRELGLSDTALRRHQAGMDAEIARAETLTALLEPAARMLRTLEERGASAGPSFGFRHQGWSFSALLPYLLRDWSIGSELQAAIAVIGPLLGEALPDPAGKTIAFAACGAAGLAAHLPLASARIIAFDLTLPVLAAARRLIDGENLDLAISPSANSGGTIRLSGRRAGPASPKIELAAMDACATAFADGVVDCAVTSFVIDLLPDPRILADEIRRVLKEEGLWLNYGPYGAIDALWRFDEAESAAFFASMGFEILGTIKHRTSYLDLTPTEPEASFQSLMCCATLCRKTGVTESRPASPLPKSEEIAQLIPEHFPGAHLIHQQRLGEDRSRSYLLRHERIRERVETIEIAEDTARILMMVDGKRSVKEIAALLAQRHLSLSTAQIVSAFPAYFAHKLLNWRRPSP